MLSLPEKVTHLLNSKIFNKLRITLSFLILLNLTAAMYSCQSNSQTPGQTALEKIDALFTARYSADTPGGAVLLLKGDSVLFDKGYGLADLETGARIDGNTFFNIASVSKQFTAVAILQLADQGKISLEDPVKKYFPEFKGDFFNRVTIRHLLSHSSGIPDERPREDRNFVLTATDMQSLEYMKELDHLNFEPGTAYEYMNPTFQLMFAIIEKVTGKTFEQYMKECVFTPAGMDETVYFEAGREIPRMSHGYITEDDGQTFREYDYGEESFFATKADGGIYTSTHEFANWEKALRSNAVLPEALREEAHSAVTTVTGSPYSSYQNRPYTSYGYGWFIEEKPDMPKKVYHTGDNGGFQIYAGRFPEKNLLCLVFENRNDHSRWQMVEQLDEIFRQAGWFDSAE